MPKSTDTTRRPEPMSAQRLDLIRHSPYADRLRDWIDAKRPDIHGSDVATALHDRDLLLDEIDRLSEIEAAWLATPATITTAERMLRLPVGTVLLWWHRGPGAHPDTLVIRATGNGAYAFCSDGLCYWLDENDAVARMVRAGRIEVAWTPGVSESGEPHGPAGEAREG
jgi:hypothetical protein